MSSDLEGDLNGDGIVDEMDRVRSDLGGDINQLGERMRNMFDWQAYVRSAPLTSAAVAVAVGFLLAPRFRSRTVPEMATSGSSSASPGGFSSVLTSMVFGGIAKAGSVYLADLLVKQLKQAAGDPSESEEPPESAQPF